MKVRKTGTIDEIRNSSNGIDKGKTFDSREGLSDSEIIYLNRRLVKPITRYRGRSYKDNNAVSLLKGYIESKGYEWESHVSYKAAAKYERSALYEEAFFFTGKNDALGMFVGHNMLDEQDDCVLERCSLDELDGLKSAPLDAPMVDHLVEEIQENPWNSSPKFLFCLVGPSGSGKTTCIRSARNRLPMGEIISMTTRQPRAGEIDGEDYFFVDKETFEERVSQDDLLESDEYAGNLYGTFRSVIRREMAHRNGAFTASTYEGYQQLSDKLSGTYDRDLRADIKVLSVFMYASKDTLRSRMESRGDAPENIRRRMENIDARDEYSNMYRCDYIFNTEKYDNVEDMSEHFARFIDEAMYDRNYGFDNINSTVHVLPLITKDRQAPSRDKDDYDLAI